MKIPFIPYEKNLDQKIVKKDRKIKRAVDILGKTQFENKKAPIMTDGLAGG